ncbi:phosphoribosylamine--glycine ligase [Legionella quateirensis]|uniref:Phosphoribosylamine--glycine ligase n=1 Tax=Legionella quateirensis TaxID=45072 RepID=A0A378L0S6_9GAMM|nr:phosphoribosylamine--glycine ligase [Legionella quateirensis]KTD51063.1 phosphoribosylamine-glycine ligase [Legionella quateirensis]STY17690.1 phosphoribosylamine--glycine ligase [Legionella quateirensis]
MNILIIGSGAREHAIAKALSISKHKPSIFCCGTSYNPGIQELSQGFWVGDITDIEPITDQAIQWRIDFAIIGPEAPLEQGLADILWDSGIPVVGPKKALAQIESSKGFTRDLMKKYQISGLPRYKVFLNHEGISEFLAELGEDNYVVKANGLMAGKGVKVAGDHLHSFAEALVFCSEIFAQGQTLVIEEKLIGQEFSFMCFSDGTSLIPMPLIQDNKRAFEEDKGPNTGGMGSYTAADHKLPFLSHSDVEQAFKIIQSVVSSLMTEIKEKYIGIIYGGFIATATGVSVIEFNARFGDPESLNVLSILESDFVDLCGAMIKGSLQSEQVQFSQKATVCKYAVPEGYPDHPLRHVEIDITSVVDGHYLYLAGVNEEKGLLYATGSRTAAYVGVANSIPAAEQIAEQELSQIKGPLFHRKDIGTSSLINKRIEAMCKLRSL